MKIDEIKSPADRAIVERLQHIYPEAADSYVDLLRRVDMLLQHLNDEAARTNALLVHVEAMHELFGWEPYS
jgi:hypothetical protein